MQQQPSTSITPTNEALEPTHNNPNPLLINKPKKPAIGPVQPATDLLRRLNDFLPQLAAANASLPPASSGAAPLEDPYLPSLQPDNDDEEEQGAGAKRLRMPGASQPGGDVVTDDDSDASSSEQDEDDDDSGIPQRTGEGRAENTSMENTSMHVEMDLACGVFELQSPSAVDAAVRASGGAPAENGETRGEDAAGHQPSALHSPAALLQAVKGGQGPADMQERERGAG